MAEIRKEKQTEEYVARDGSCANRNETRRSFPSDSACKYHYALRPMLPSNGFLIFLPALQLRETGRGGEYTSVYRKIETKYHYPIRCHPETNGKLELLANDKQFVERGTGIDK